MNSGGSWRGQAALLGWLATNTCAFAQATNMTVEITPLPDVGGSVVRVLGALALVLALFFGGMWCFKNWQRISRFKGRPSDLTVFEVRALDSRHVLYVIGYKRQRMLVASSPTGITLLSHLPESETSETDSMTGFAVALQQATIRKP